MLSRLNGNSYILEDEEQFSVILLWLLLFILIRVAPAKNWDLLQKSKSKLLKEYQTIGNEQYEKNFDCR
jgi:hypothetical protein